VKHKPILLILTAFLSHAKNKGGCFFLETGCRYLIKSKLDYVSDEAHSVKVLHMA